LIEDKNIIDILEKCKSDMHIKRHIAIVQDSNIKSPAIFSLIKPKILMPLNIIENMSDNDIRNIFLHELSHYKRKDMFINYVIRIINVIYWFNPIIWYFANELKKDMELSCDQFALYYVKSDKLKDYGYTMIDVIKYSKLNEKRELNMAVGISVNITDMTKRMNMIKQFKRNSYKTIISSLFILSLLSIIMLTEAKINSVFSEDVSNNQITSKYIVDELGRNKIVDKIDYPYEYDPKVEGHWIGVDLVGYVSDFKKDKKSWNGDLFTKELTFFKDGTTNYEWLTWTKGIAIDKTYKLSSQYFIKDIDGESYMFFQWKGGDYAYGCRRPMYYVLKKVKAFSNKNVQ
jgi:bla regulator protein BlaR1